MKTKFVMLALTMCFWIISSQVQAVPITIEIKGNVTTISGTGVPETIYGGLSFTGSYTYESVTTDSDTSLTSGIYNHDAPFGINLLIGGYELKTADNHTGKFNVQIMNDEPILNMWDFYIINSEEIVSVPSNGLAVDHIRWSLGDGSHTALDSDVLPVIAPVLTDWSHNAFKIIGVNNSFTINGVITEAVIPEPLTLTLMVMGAFFSLGKHR